MIDNTETQVLILVIEDNPSDLRILSQLVKDQGTILFATSGKDGLQAAISKTPDLILLDVELPDIDGYQLCKRIKAHEECQGIPVIFVTGHNTTENEVLALESGAVDFITKPFNPPVIAARVRTHLTLKRQSDLLHDLAEKDGLTDVFNRRYFDLRAEQEWKRHLRQKHSFGLALLDVDYFKMFNDHYGHTQGDNCLKLVAGALKSCTRRPDEFVARYGGEEFICVLPNSQPDDLLKFGQHVCEKIQQLKIAHLYSETASVVTVSVGVCAMVPSINRNLIEMIERTDQALYTAKRQGRNQIQLADPI